MFGFQRIGDLTWLAGDIRSKGFLIGGTAGRTTLAGEGLQHQDGNSHLLSYPIPNLLAYDPAFAYEIAVIIQDGIKRMYVDQEDIYYYLTVMNENYSMPPMPEGSREGILKGIYLFKKSEKADLKLKANLLGSGAILNEVLKAAEILERDYNVSTDVWSVTSYKQLHVEAMETERWNMLHPEENNKIPFIKQQLGDADGVIVSASDYVQLLADSLSKYLPKPIITLGTFGFGRSEDRASLRDFFEVDAKHIAWAVLAALAKDKCIKESVLKKAKKDLGINPDKPNPIKS
jgi:pyruvate dehydrogenase E1 component